MNAVCCILCREGVIFVLQCRVVVHILNLRIFSICLDHFIEFDNVSGRFELLSLSVSVCREYRVVSLNAIGNVQLSLGNPDVKRVITTYMSRLTNFIEDELGTTN